MNAFYVVPEKHGSANVRFGERMALRVVREGRERKDVVSELLKYLRFRYELQERAIVHHAKLAADAMLGKMLELWYDGEWLARAEARGGAEVEDKLAARPVRVDDVRDALYEDTGDRRVAADVDRLTGEALERRIRGLGDDGLLEFLHREQLRIPDSHRRHVQRLAGELLVRRLYKQAAQAKGGLARKDIYKKFHARSERKRLEQKAARYAGVSEAHVAIWLPDPRMRLKIARVLVDGGSGILPFDEYTRRGSEIYDDHRRLWTITVFVHESVRQKELEPVVLAKLAELMDVEWDRHKPARALRPADWPYALLVQQWEEETRGRGSPEVIAEAKKVAYRSREATFRRQLSELHRKLL